MKKRRQGILFLSTLFLVLLFSSFVTADIKDTAIHLNRLELRDGDVNLDGKVNVMDLAIVGLNFGKTVEGENWDWKVDIANTVGEIDIFDLAEVGLNFGKSYNTVSNDPVFVSPGSKEVLQGQDFSVYINISTLGNVYGVDFILSFDPSILKVKDITEGNFLKKDGKSTSMQLCEQNVVSELCPIIDNSAGRIEFANVRLGTSQGITGDGTLAKIDFKAISIGISDLNFVELILVDPNLNEIPGVETVKGTVKVISGEFPSIVTYDIDNPYFSPDGDGIKDNVTIDLGFSEEVDYKIEIVNSSDSTVKEWTGKATNPLPKTWDGKINGLAVEGAYTIRVTMKDADNNIVIDESKSIVVDVTSPIISNIDKQPEPSYNDDNVNLSVDVIDKNLDKVLLESNFEGVFKNYTLTSGSKYSYLISSAYLENQQIVDHKFYALDLAGNDAESDLLSFKVQNRNPTVDIPDQETDEDIKPALINLLDYSSDADKDDLTFKILSQSNPSLISCSLVSDKIDCSKPALNQYGSSEITVEVSDGIETVADSFLMIVKPINDAPVIDSYFPLENPTIEEKQSQEFNIQASDADGDSLTIKWYLDGEEVETGNSYAYIANCDSQGTHEVKVVVNDGKDTVEHVWQLTVLDTCTRIFLTAGNNIFSLPRNQEKSFNELDTNCEVVYESERADLAYYLPSEENISSDNYVFLTLNEILYPGQGYFVKVEDNCYIEMTGDLVEISDLGYLGAGQLLEGWNLVGALTFPTVFSQGTCSLFGGVGILKYGYNVANCNEVEGYNGGYAYCTIEGGISRCRCAVNNFEPGLGYWIRTANDCSLA